MPERPTVYILTDEEERDLKSLRAGLRADGSAIPMRHRQGFAGFKIANATWILTSAVTLSLTIATGMNADGTRFSLDRAVTVWWLVTFLLALTIGAIPVWLFLKRDSLRFHARAADHYLSSIDFTGREPLPMYAGARPEE